MAEFTGNVHSLELTLPLPPPDSGASVFAVGRHFGEDNGTGIWVDPEATTSYDQPDGPVVQLEVASLLAVTHGWLRFVPAGRAVPGLHDRTGAPLNVGEPALVLSVWATLRDNLERMAEIGNALVPQVAAGKGGRPALEHLVYANVDPDSVPDAAADLIAEARPDPPVGATQRGEMLTAFMAGDLPILARAGRVLGRAGSSAGTGSTPQGWLRVTLFAVDRLGQLFDAGYLLRRIADLAHVPEVPVIVDKTLIPSRQAIGDHPLPGLTRARRIVDWRDAWGRPRAGRQFLLEPSGASLPTTTPKTTDGSGLWIGPEMPSDGDPTAVTTMVVGAATDHVAVGMLPNADRSAFRLSRHVLADDYLVVSEVDLDEWFPERPPASGTIEPLRHYTQGNRVTPLVDGREGFLAVYQALRRTFRDDDFSEDDGQAPPPDGEPWPETVTAQHKIWLAGWRLSPHLYLRDLPEDYTEIDFGPDGVAPVSGSPPGTPGFDPRGHVMGVLRAAIDAGVDVRALLWRQLEFSPNHRSNNTAAVAAINAASTVDPARRGQAILDDVCRITGSHHQKIVVVENADGRQAFLGGLDLSLSRWDSDEHRPGEPRSQDGRRSNWSGWHDVYCRIEGPAVDDVEHNLRQRWNHNPQSSSDGRTPVPARSQLLDPLPDGSHFVQINRIIASGLPAYQFVPESEGERSALAARLKAIRRARSHIHLEDQFLVMIDDVDEMELLRAPDPLAFTPSNRETPSAALRSRIVAPDPVRVVIVIPQRLEEEPEFANMVLYELRRRFIRFLTHGLSDEQIRDRLLVMHLRNSSGRATYVHAKTLIVDDIYASIGSTNMGYRSMTYDSEINCDVIDGAIRGGRRPLPTDLRVRLWAEHLRLGPHERHLVLDPRNGFELLRRAADADWPRTHAVMPYNPEYYGDYQSPPNGPPPYDPDNDVHDLLRHHFVDPNGSEPDDPLLDYAALLARFQDV